MITEKAWVFVGRTQRGARSYHTGSAESAYLPDMAFLMHNGCMNIRSA